MDSSRAPRHRAANYTFAMAFVLFAGCSERTSAAEPGHLEDGTLGAPLDVGMSDAPTGIGECDHYIARMNRCLLPALPPEEQDRRLGDLKQQIVLWRAGGSAARLACSRAEANDLSDLRGHACVK